MDAGSPRARSPDLHPESLQPPQPGTGARDVAGAARPGLRGYDLQPPRRGPALWRVYPRRAAAGRHPLRHRARRRLRGGPQRGGTPDFGYPAADRRGPWPHRGADGDQLGALPSRGDGGHYRRRYGCPHGGERRCRGPGQSRRRTGPVSTKPRPARIASWTSDHRPQ